MNYSLKDKIVATEEFLSELIAKSWQESEEIQQQISNIDNSTRLGAEVVKLLKGMCSNYYVLIGCLENLADGTVLSGTDSAEPLKAVDTHAIAEVEELDKKLGVEQTHGTILATPAPAGEETAFEPFEYFVDFDEPSGDPITDEDLYNN